MHTRVRQSRCYLTPTPALPRIPHLPPHPIKGTHPRPGPHQPLGILRGRCGACVQMSVITSCAHLLLFLLLLLLLLHL